MQRKEGGEKGSGMGSEWSRYVQSSGELYYSRLLRFTEENQALWLPALGAGEEGMFWRSAAAAAAFACG